MSRKWAMRIVLVLYATAVGVRWTEAGNRPPPPKVAEEDDEPKVNFSTGVKIPRAIPHVQPTNAVPIDILATLAAVPESDVPYESGDGLKKKRMDDWLKSTFHGKRIELSASV